jgi:adenylate cyclase
MAKEIERKFRVIDDSWRSSAEKTTHVVQGYLSKSLERVVRVRTTDDRVGAITIKGITSGFTRRIRIRNPDRRRKRAFAALRTTPG